MEFDRSGHRLLLLLLLSLLLHCIDIDWVATGPTSIDKTPVFAHLISIFQECLSQICRELHIIQDLWNLHSSLYLAPALRLLTLYSDLDELRGKLICPVLTLTIDKRLIVWWQHHHVLGNSEKWVLYRSLLNQSEKHGWNVRLPRDLVVLLKYLETQIASKSSWLVSYSRLRLLMDRIYHSKEIRVNFTECNKVLAG